MTTRLSIATCGLLTSLAAPTLAQEGHPSQSTSVVRTALLVIDEARATLASDGATGRFRHLALVQPRLSWRHRDRWWAGARLVGSVETGGSTEWRGRLRDAYAGVSLGGLDLSAGRRIVRWGTGYAFTPSGLLDPPRDAADPTDRLDRSEGRDLIMANWVGGRHGVTLAWARERSDREAVTVPGLLALRYNVLAGGVEAALVVARAANGEATWAGSASRVIGRAVEVHGEMAYRSAPSVLVGSKWTAASGLTLIAEFATLPGSPGPLTLAGAPTAAGAAGTAAASRQAFGFVRLGKSRLREQPGWKEWDVAVTCLADLSDGSQLGVLDASRRMGHRFGTYLRLEVPRGGPASRFGSMPSRAVVTLGVRAQL